MYDQKALTRIAASLGNNFAKQKTEFEREKKFYFSPTHFRASSQLATKAPTGHSRIYGVFIEEEIE